MNSARSDAVPDGVAIVGMSVLLPGAPDLDTYWRNLVAGVDCITEVPANRLDPGYYDPDPASGPATPDRIYCRRGGFVDDHARVEPTRFGIMPSSVSGIEPDQLIALHVAEAAIRDAGGADRLPTRDRVGVILGRGGYLTPGQVRLDQRVRSLHQVLRTVSEIAPQLDAEQLGALRAAFLAQLGPDRPESAIGLVPNLAASRIANRLDLRGPAMTVDAACASSLIAVDQAVSELVRGRCDVMLAGGTHHCHDITLWSVFTQLGALSTSQRTRPFHRDADGILIGEGTGIIVLKRLSDAVADGDRVYAVIRGTGVASDGRTAALASPDPGGQTRAVRAAWAAAGLDPAVPDSVGLIEAHGTGTPAGDGAELTTLAEVFGGPDPGRERAVLGSVKSMIGHTMPAAGVAGLVKAALAIHHGVLPPTLHCDDPHPALAATRFRTISAAVPWESAGARRAGVNAFGFGGINAHAVLEQAPRPVRARRSPDLTPGQQLGSTAVSEPDRVLRLAAGSPAELAALLDAPDVDLITAGMRLPAPDAPPCRLAIMDPTPKRLALARWAVERGDAWRGRNDVWFSPVPMIGPRAAGRVAFLFPGLEDTFAPRVADVAGHFHLPTPHLRGGAGAAGMGATGEVDVVGDVGRHAVAVMAVGRLLNDAMHRIGIDPDAVAGHSVGEWTAMVAGGLFSAEDSDKFLTTFDPDTVRVPGLAFAALGASAELVTDELAARQAAVGTRIVLSHDNAPQQSIVCGPQDEVEAFVLAMRARGILGQTLAFRSGFHTPMLAPYLGPIREDAEAFEIHPARVPVWSATTAAEFPAQEAAVRELFVRHLLEPVRFRLLLNQMYAAGFRAFVQLGVGQVTALVGDTLRDRDHVAVAACSPRRDGLAQLNLVAAALWACGAEPDSVRLTAVARPDVGEEHVHASVRLDLGGATVSLDAGRLPTLQAFLRPQPALGPRPDLSELGGRFPLLAEFEALMQETERSALALLAAGRDALTTHQVGGRQVTVPQETGHETRPGAPQRRTSVLRVSLESMPYLIDHSFFSQRPGWPDPRDLFPVVPATAITTHLIEAACAGEPGRVAVAVADLRFEKWVPAIPGHDVEIALEATADGRLSARFGSYARGIVALAPAYPPAPARWPVDVARERRPAITAAELYADRWMFHGPAYQGVTELTAVSDTEIRGVITAPEAPGSLLDNVGHFLGQWIVETQTDRLVVFPTRLSEIRFYSPTPSPGSVVTCHLRIVEASEQAVSSDVQLCVRRPDGSETVWAELSGWRERRFDSDLESYNVYLHVERFGHGVVQPGGWVLVEDQWPDLATRDIIMRGYLGAGEREAYERQPPRARRGWFLGRLAAKDAVRHLLWAGGEGEFWPAEIAVDNDERGKPYVRGMHGRVLPRLEISIAHCAEAAVAVARPAAELPAGAGVGIDIEEVLARPPEAVDFALGRAERELLETCLAGGEPPQLWFTRFWTAKEAVAKARGTGLAGRPRDFAVVSADQRQIWVAVADDKSERPLHYRVDLHRLTNRPGMPPRDYVVAVAGNGPTTAEIGHHHRERMTTV